MVSVHGQCELFEIVAALHASRGFASGLHRRKQQGDQDANDRNHDQELDQGKTVILSPEKFHCTVSIHKSHPRREYFRDPEKVAYSMPARISDGGCGLPAFTSTALNPYHPGDSTSASSKRSTEDRSGRP
jgi:hypothetical protein